MWWKKSYVNRRDWILENLGELDLNSNQVIVLMMIDLYNQENRPINLKDFSQACGMRDYEVDETIASLVQSNILEIKAKKDRVQFSIDNLFSKGIMYEYVDEDIFHVFESEFGRLLSQNELMRLNKWLSEYSQNEILEALRSALIYHKTSMPYIETILINNRNEDKNDS